MEVIQCETMPAVRSMLNFTKEQVIIALRNYSILHGVEFNCTAAEMFLQTPNRHSDDNAFKLGVDKKGTSPGIISRTGVHKE